MSEYFIQTIVDKLKIKNLFFSGPDFHFSDDRILAIDFNPRTGQFINILDQVNDYEILIAAMKGDTVNIRKKLLWGCAVLEPGIVANVQHLDSLNIFMNAQNTVIEPGVVIPEFQNLQNKAFNVNLDITGNDEQELFNNYIAVNQLLQKCISY